MYKRGGEKGNKNIKEFWNKLLKYKVSGEAKIPIDNNYTNKILLGNNKSYISFNTFFSNVILNNNNNPETADKKLKKHLSNLLTESNAANINVKINNNNTKSNNNIYIDNNTAKHKIKTNKNKKHTNKDLNKKNLLNMIYLSKKGCYNQNNNNYDHNANIVNINNNICINNTDKAKIDEKERNMLFLINFMLLLNSKENLY